MSEHAEHAERAHDEGDQAEFDDFRARFIKLAEGVLPLFELIANRRRENSEADENERHFIRETSFWERCYLTALSNGLSPAGASAIAHASMKERDTLFDPGDEGQVVPLHAVDDAAEAGS